MHIKKITIDNLFSFKDAEFEFDRYNVIVGPNNAGKTNLIRILKSLSKADSLESFRINKRIKHDPKKPSSLSILIHLNDDEIRLILEFLFFKKIVATSFPNSLKNLRIIINWNDIVGDEPVPNNTFYLFQNGLTISSAHGNNVVFVTQSISDDDSIVESFIRERIQFVPANLTSHFHQSGYGTNPALWNSTSLLDDVLNDKPIVNCFYNARIKHTTHLQGDMKYDSNSPQEFQSDVFDYVGMQKNTVQTIPFAYLISRIFKNNIITVDEIHPSYNELTENLFNLKVSDETAYTSLQGAFSTIFPNSFVRVEQDRRNTANKNMIITDDSREFPIEASASGYYAAIHILYTILNKPESVIILDEPELHFHPSKVRQLSREFIELSKTNNNQVVIITHSPDFIDRQLLQVDKPFTVSSIKKINNMSIVKSKTKEFINSLKPHIFNPSVFFSNCTIIVEGPGDEFALRAISEHFDGIFEKYNIAIMNCWGVSHINPAIDLHEFFHIPFVAMVDSDYSGDRANIIKLEKDLEGEFEKLGWQRQKDQKLRIESAYALMLELIKKQDGLKKFEISGIGMVFNKSISLAGGRSPFSKPQA